MPELPEVQTVLATLENMIKGRQIIGVEVISPSVVMMDTEDFISQLTGQHFVSFKRRGKYLIFEMDTLSLVSHLRMEGKYFIQPQVEPIKKHTHVLFHLDDGSDLRYHDVRRFGRMELVEKDDEYRFLHELGPEPFSTEWNAELAWKQTRNSKKSLKMTLMDQHFVAGIGNIYADEICYRSKVRPDSKVAKVSKKRWEEIIQHTKDVLNEAVEHGGSTVRSYTSSLGVTGLFQLQIDVYGRENEPCHRCGTPIRKIRHGQRGTHFCPKCQRRL